MDERSRLGLGVLGAALVLGLLRATPWGINLFLRAAALVGAAAVVAWRGRLQVAGEGRWLVPVADLTVGEVILDRYREAEEGDWRPRNLSRSRASHLAETYSGPGQIPAETSAEHAREVNFT